MTTDTTYNGWTNYATWRVNLEVFDCADFFNPRDYTTIGELARAMEEQVDEVLTNYGEIKDGLALDYARSFVSDVNWYEIASHYYEETEDEPEDDEEEDHSPNQMCRRCDSAFIAHGLQFLCENCLRAGL